MIPWLDIVGVTESEMPVIPPGRTIIGPSRLLDRLAPAPATEGRGPPHAKTVEWPSGLDAMLAQVEAHRGTPTTILASGDPLWFGIGSTLLRHLDPAEIRFAPAASSFQLAAARLRWPLQHVATLSLHARPAELIHPHIAPGNRILALTSDATTAPHVARLLVERGYGRSVLTILENLGAADERIASAAAAGFDLSINDFHVLAVDCAADPGAPLLAAIPGLPDDAFVSDGQLTKREVRAVTLARLSPYPGAQLWDVGAGSGSIGIEWMRAARDATATAFEREGERLQMIAVNAARLGVPHLAIAPGDAPDTLHGHAAPDAVFLGGGVADEPLFHACWTALRSGGRFVANAVTLDAEAALFRRQARLGGELVRIEIAALDRIGDHRALRPRLPVTQWAVTKP
ncbi:MAG TPA: precorrin-6y C5,15-methyltransferase (decarboxylating) subunit CbiE [Devosia sp.]|nr:precorrin-6y C5,15-methyltransferase (decarboxylating) subunit CbiE [Devosia sp.]